MINENRQIQAIFNRIAPIYDRMNDWLSLGQHRIWKKMAVRWSEAKLGDTALDLCCGSGDLAQLLAQQVGTPGQVFGVDFSQNQLEIARQRDTPFTIDSGSITWIEADALSLPFEDETFDCATMGYGLRNVVDIPQSLQEMYRVLKPGATAAILDMNRPSNSQSIRFQAWYLETIVVPLAQQMGFQQEYAYINPSIEKFPTGTEQMALAQRAGFSQATYYAIAGGMMGVLVVHKDSDRNGSGGSD